eukprot:g2002.t1
MIVKSAANISNQRPTTTVPITSKAPRFIVENGFRWESRRSRVRKSRALTLTREHQYTQSSEGTSSLHGLESMRSLGEMMDFPGLHHVGLLCKNLDTSLKFYCEILGMSVNPDRPHKKLPYRGAWLSIGSEMIHLMELSNPVLPKTSHGVSNRHISLGISSTLAQLITKLQQHGIKYNTGTSGKRTVFFEDPDANCIEVFQVQD